MRDISLHLLDLVQNSIKAQASLINIEMTFNPNGQLHITLADDGKGMTEAYAKSVQNPFVTSRSERKVGLGIPMFAENARLTGGNLVIKSILGKGTTLEADFDTTHIDCLPMGDICETLYSLIIMNPLSPDFIFSYKNEKEKVCFDTREIRQAVGNLPLNEPEIAAWIHEALYEEMKPIMEG